MADFSTVAAGDTLELLVKARVFGPSATGNGLYFGSSAAGTFIQQDDVVDFTKVYLPWAEGDAVRVTSLDVTLVRTADSWWVDPTQASMPDEDVDRYQSLGELKVLYAPGRG